MIYKRPPRGYKLNDFPLPHKFAYWGSLSAKSVNEAAVMLTLIRSSESQTAIEAVEVNPIHTNFAEETGPTIALGSIVEKWKCSMDFQLSKNAIETDKVRNLLVHWMPIYSAFREDLEAKDDKSDTEIEDILFLTRNDSTKTVLPTMGTDKVLSGGLQPLNTVNDTEVFGDYGLTTNNILETVRFLSETYRDAMRFFSNRGLLKKLTGRIHVHRLSRDKNIHIKFPMFVNPRVKRGNPYMFCAVLIWLEQGNTTTSHNQIVSASELTVVSLGHVNFVVRCEWDEWNPQYDQTASS